MLVPGLLVAAPAGGAYPCPGYAWNVKCDLADCGFLVDSNAFDLATASQWLDDLNFYDPKIETEGGSCIAHVSAEAASAQERGGYLGVYLEDEQEIHLDPGLDAALGEFLSNPASDTTWNIALGDLYTPVHELFHAVQAAYGSFGDELNWIIEGGADVVMYSYMKHHEPDKTPSIRLRRFDVPLHEPIIGDLGDYRTAVFWAKVGKKIESRAYVRYLHDILQKLSNNQQMKGVAAVDEVLRPSYGGLHELLPWFFSQIPWNDKSFHQVKDLGSVRLPQGETRKTFVLPEKSKVNVRELAGSWLQFEVDASGGNRPVEVEIQIKAAGDGAGLHLLVDEMGPLQGGLYRDIVKSGTKRKLQVLVANVAETATNTESQRFQLEVKLRQIDFCTMTARLNGDVSGYLFGDVAHFSTTGAATILGTFSNLDRIDEILGAFGVSGAGGQQPASSPAPGGQMPRETLGISVTSQRLDEDAQAQLAFLAGGFKLQASVFGREVEDGFRGELPLTFLEAVPGVRADSTLDQVPFRWVPGAPGYGRLMIDRFTGDLLEGSVSAHLYSDGYYWPDTRLPAEIDVQVDFVALEGPAGCLGMLTGL